MTGHSDQINDLRLRLEVECDRLGISRAELARRVSKTPQALNDIVSRGNMKATLAKAIADVLAVPIEVLLSPVSDHEYAEAKKLRMERRREPRTEIANTGTDGDEFFG